jgi:hypothetical protein
MLLLSYVVLSVVWCIACLAVIISYNCRRIKEDAALHAF